MSTEIQPELVSERDAAKLLGLSAITLAKQRSGGARNGHLPPIPFVRWGRRCIRYRISDLRAYAERYLINPAMHEEA